MDPGPSNRDTVVNDNDSANDQDQNTESYASKQMRIRKRAQGRVTANKKHMQVAQKVLNEGDNTVTVKRLDLGSTPPPKAWEPLCMDGHTLAEFMEAFRKTLLEDRKAHINATVKKKEFKISLSKWTAMAKNGKIPLHFTREPGTKQTRSTADQLLAFDAAYKKKLEDLRDLIRATDPDTTNRFTDLGTFIQRSLMSIHIHVDCEDSSFPAFLPTSVTMSSALTLWTGGGGTLGRTGPSTSPE